ncbi:MAG: hypothetical protein KAY37_07860 [Phycisphaerae bacterium]|nr:hypothetical protein [Phycisphaerae bacterium]
MQTLLTSDEGKRLAHDPAGFIAYLELDKNPVVSLDEVKLRMATVSAIVQRLRDERERADLGFLLGDYQDIKTEADKLAFWAKDRLPRLVVQESTLDTILAEAPTGIDLSKAKTLAKAMQDYRARWHQLLADSKILGYKLAEPESQKILIDATRAAQLDLAKEERDRIRKEAQIEIERMRIDFEIRLKRMKQEEEARRIAAEVAYDDAIAELERMRAEAKTKRDVADIESKLARNDQLGAAQHEERMAKAQSPEVQALLSPFITKAYSQPGKKTGARKTGVSLSALRATGALQPTVKGLTKLHRLGTKKQEDKERPRWGFASYFNRMSPEDREQLQKAQDYLNELGDTLVELGMLAP